jgi:DNA-binding transcriptional regulator LsrR (DeoR family)
VASAGTRDALIADPSVACVLAVYRTLTVLLVGIGSLEPSVLLRQGGNAIAQQDQDELQRVGAVGDVCLRFFDAAGQPVISSLEGRVIGITADELRAVPRVIGVAGGSSNVGAIGAALLGKWVDVLITDLQTASALAR